MVPSLSPVKHFGGTVSRCLPSLGDWVIFRPFSFLLERPSGRLGRRDSPEDLRSGGPSLVPPRGCELRPWTGAGHSS